MKSKIQHLVLLAIAIVFISTGCSSLKVSADYDKTVDFTKYKTIEYYGWQKESDKLLNGLDKTRIEDAFANEFYSRGMSLVNDNGDLVVTLYIVVENKTETTATTSHMGYGGYYGGYYGYGPGWGWGPSYSTTSVRSYDYKVGTLICSVYDKAKEQLIWEGYATKTIDEDPGTREDNIPKVVAVMMKKYPVEPTAAK